MLILGFDWDEVNEEKVRHHGLEPEDIEILFDEGRPLFLPHRTNRRRHIALGFAPGERFVLAVFEYDAKTRWVRVVTAYEPTGIAWWKAYARARGVDDR